jgi:signal peptidase I
MFLASPVVNGQMTSTAVAKDTIIWIKGKTAAENVIDTVYVFAGNQLGNITVYQSDSICKYEWFRLDSLSKTFVSFKADTLSFKESSVADNLAQGGYQIKRKSAKGSVDTLHAWIYQSKIWMRLTQTTNKEVPITKYTCSNLELNVKGGQNAFYYLSKGGVWRSKGYRPSYSCTADPDEIADLDTSSAILTNTASIIVTTPKADLTTFTVTVTDRFKLTDTSDYVTFKTIVPTADFTWSGEHKVDDTKNSAPFKVTFKNLSKNSIKYTYFTRMGDTIVATDTSRVTCTYTYPKTYRVTLLAESDKGCLDSVWTGDNLNSDRPELVISPAELNAGNVFCPGSSNEDLQYFKIHNVSIAHYKLQIFSRWGKLVYEKENNTQDPEEIKWDGNLRNGKEAPDGMYYYVLQVTPYNSTEKATENPVKSSGKYSGYVYLFRAK